MYGYNKHCLKTMLSNSFIVMVIWIFLQQLSIEHVSIAEKIQTEQACLSGVPLEFRKTENATFILGGMFSMHFLNTRTSVWEYHTRALKWIESMTYAIEEINNKNDILPNITLGYRIFDSCGNVNTALKATMQLIHGDHTQKNKEVNKRDNMCACISS